MAQENRESGPEAQPDEITLLKKHARRRLIGAVAVALFAAIVLPMVMDNQPAPPLKDLQVRIPSPDEGADRKAAGTEKPIARTEAKPIAKPEPKSEAKPTAGSEDKAEAKPENGNKPEAKAENKPVTVPAAAEPKPPAKTESKAEGKSSASGESWEVQLGAYAETGRVKNLLAKLKELGLPAYTEKVDTPNGARTRVRAGPFPSQEAAEKARARIKTIGVDGPVAKKS